MINLFSKLCLLLNKQGWISTLCADRAEASYKFFIADAAVKNWTNVFYLSHLSRHVELREVLKLEMILSHSNARVESGYSANEEIIVENMSQGSLVTRRMVFDGVMNKENISNVDVNRKMLKFVNNAHSEYVKQLEKKKEQQTSGGKKRAEKRKITNELKKGKEAKQKIEEQH